MYCIFKRFFDVVISIFTISIIFPIFIIVILVLYFANKDAGVFFTQERPGKNKKIFKLIKFKTMTDTRDKQGNLRPDATRLTKIGKFVQGPKVSYRQNHRKNRRS